MAENYKKLASEKFFMRKPKYFELDEIDVTKINDQ
jgi:hypothetical protein